MLFCMWTIVFTTKLFDFKIFSLIPRNRVLKWAKSIKLSTFCKDALRQVNYFCRIRTVDFFWRISSLNKFDWHCLIVENFKWLFATWQFKNLGITLLLLICIKTQYLTLLYVNDNHVSPFSEFFWQYSHYILLELLQ